LRNNLLKLTLINKKSNNVASRDHWWLALGAYAHLQGDTRGIAGLLPNKKGKKILARNYLTLKDKRPGIVQPIRALARQQAKLILPSLELIYRSTLKHHQKFLKKQFCVWVKHEINTPFSNAHKLATELGFDCIVEGNHGVRWWMDQLKKCRVKHITSLIS
jgi:hypothetical protein